MLNESYILQVIKPHLNAKCELSEFEFFELFSCLERREQYEVVNIMIAHNIDLVEEKEEEAEQIDQADIIRRSTADTGYEQMLRLSNEELCVLAQRGDARATAAVLKKNERFVYQLASKLYRQFDQSCLTIEDLFQEGNLGLLEAIQRFDAGMDNTFLTYSWHWIRQKITRAAIDQGYLVRLPVHVFEQVRKITVYRSRYPEASLTELFERMKAEGQSLTLENVRFYAMLGELYLNTASLNALIREDSETELQDILPDEDAPSVEDEIVSVELRELCERILKTLTPKEEKVIRLRFGLDGGRRHTLEEVGGIFQVTRERIRQIEKKALKKLRHPSRAKQLEDFVT